jgi:hypothetical protein
MTSSYQEMVDTITRMDPEKSMANVGTVLEMLREEVPLTP